MRFEHEITVAIRWIAENKWENPKEIKENIPETVDNTLRKARRSGRAKKAEVVEIRDWIKDTVVNLEGDKQLVIDMVLEILTSKINDSELENPSKTIFKGF